jgi:hypothetical protein
VARDQIDIAVRAAILAVPGVSAILGTRVFADDAVPEREEFPYAVVTMIGDSQRVYSLNGGAMKTINARYQVDFYAQSKTEARNLRNKVTARRQDDGLDGARGTWGAGDDAAYVQKCLIENRRTGSELLAEGSDRWVYFAGADLVVTFNE